MKKSQVVPLMMLVLFVLPLVIYLFLAVGTKQNFDRVPFQYNIVENGDTVYHSLPNFALNDLYADSLYRKDLDQKICVISFFSIHDDSLMKTTVLNGNLKRVYDNIDWEKNPPFKFISINTGDSPEKVRAYADSMGINPKHWLFLNGSQNEIFRLGSSSFEFPDFINKLPGSEPFTSQTVVLIDKAGRARNYYIGTDLVQERKIQEDLIALLRIDYGV